MNVFKRVGMTQAEIEEILGEAILLSRIGHPNIIRVFDANTFEGDKGVCGYFTMEVVPGGNLDRFWRSHGASLVPIETTIEMIRQVCRGLSVAYRETPPIIHRDIKPQNILIGYEADGQKIDLSTETKDQVLPQHYRPTGSHTLHPRTPTVNIWFPVG